MDITYDKICKKCKFGTKGIDVRDNRYRIFCNNLIVQNGVKSEPPVCGWNGSYPLFEKREKDIIKSSDEVIHEFENLFYSTLKGRILTVFESQIDLNNSNRGMAVKSIVGNILSQTEQEMKMYLMEVFNDWNIKK